MGEHEGIGWAEPPSGLLLNGLLPNEAVSMSRVLDRARWSLAEEKTAELIACIQPNQPSEELRNAVADYVQRLIMKCFPCQVFTFGSVPLKTYLPDGDIDVTAFSKNQTLKDTWAHQVRDMLQCEEKNENAEFRVKEVQYIQAEVKIVKCLVENIVVDISFNQLGGLCTLCFLGEVDHLIHQNHLFKRSIILIKAWCYYESRILGAHHGLISTYALETLVLYIFHVFNNSFAGPLEVLYRFLEFFSKFDWESFCVSLWGPVPIISLPDVTAEPPRKDGGELLLSKVFLDACSLVYAVFPGVQENQGQPFISKHFNVIDPLRVNNNLGRSVSKGNFFRIRSAFAFGAKRLARLLDCPKEELFYEVNQFFMNTWDRHGSGYRPDAPKNNLWHFRLSNPDHPQGSENLEESLNSKRNGISSDNETQAEGTHGARGVLSQHGNYPLESTYRKGNVSTVSHTQSQKTYANLNNSKSDKIKRDVSSNQSAYNDQGQKSSRPDNLVNDIQGRYLFARTHSSPELTDTYREASSQGVFNRGPESESSPIISAKLDYHSSQRKNLEPDILSSHSIRSSSDDPTSSCYISSHQSLDASADSNSRLNSYQDHSVLEAMVFSSEVGTRGIQQEEQDVVNMMGSSTAHSFNPQVQIPLNFFSGHLPLPVPSSILASMGYAQRSLGETLPTTIPFIEAPWGTNMQFQQSLISSPLSHCFPGVGLSSSLEDIIELVNENYSSTKMSLGEPDHDYWHEGGMGSSGGFDLDNGILEMLQSDDNHKSTSGGYKFLTSCRVGGYGNPQIIQQKGSARQDHAEIFKYQDDKGSEIYVYVDDRTTSSRSVPASNAGSLRSQISSESSWEGSTVKVSNSVWERKGRRVAPAVTSSIYGKGKSMPENSSSQFNDGNRDRDPASRFGAEIIERSTVPQSIDSLHLSRHQIPEFKQSQSSGSDSPIPNTPLLGPGSGQTAMDNGVVPFAFYPTGPPVPFVTMLPVYNLPPESGTSDASTSHFSGDEGLENNDCGQNLDLSEGVDHCEVLSTSSSLRRPASVEQSEQKADILKSDFTSHWQNLQYGRFCQNSLYPAPMVYPSPAVMPPIYLQGSFPWDGPGRPHSNNMNLFTQLMNYGPHLVPIAPLQSVMNRPASVHQSYVDEMPRYRSGTGTYLPNPKISSRDRHSANTRKGNYSYDRSEHHGDREGKWNTISRLRASGRNPNRSQVEKSNIRPERLSVSENQANRSSGPNRHDSFPSHHSQSGQVHSNSNQSGYANLAYDMYPLPAMTQSGASSDGPTIPSVVMLYPYDHNTGYGSPADQLEFGSLGPMGFTGMREASQLSEGSCSIGVFDERRFHQGRSAQLSSSDLPSSPQQRGL